MALLLFTGLNGQVVQEHRFRSSEIERVTVDASLLSRLEVEESTTGFLDLCYRAEGEYQEGTELTLHSQGKELRIGCEYATDFVVPGDKLSAHKVYSVDISIRIPSGKSLAIRGESVRVDCSGRFRSLDIQTTTGDCSLSVRCPYANVQTISGRILAELNEGTVYAESKYGEVRLSPIPESADHYRLSSIRGDVVVEPYN